MRKIFSLIPESSLKNFIRGVYHIHWNHKKYWVRHQKGIFTIYFKNGKKIQSIVDPGDSIDATVNGYYNSYSISKGDVIIDAGAHVGIFSLIAAADAGPTGKVIAFEPDEENYALLFKNIQLNKFTNIIPIKKALWDKKSHLPFYNDSSMTSSLFFDKKKKKNILSVMTTTLDDELRLLKISTVNFIKMDIEGAEIRALKGAKNTIQKCAPAFAIASYHIINGKQTYFAVQEFLSQASYAVKTEFHEQLTTYGYALHQTLKFKSTQDLRKEIFKKYTSSPYVFMWRFVELKRIIEMAKKYHIVPKSSLDIGCGDGFIGGLLFKKMSCGIDLKMPELSHALSDKKYNTTIRANAEILPFQNNSFDFIFSNSAIEHMGNVEGVFAECNRVLKPKGYILMTTIEYNFITDCLPGFRLLKSVSRKGYTNLKKRVEVSFSNHNYFDKKRIELLANQNNLKIIEYDTYFSLPEMKLFHLLRIFQWKADQYWIVKILFKTCIKPISYFLYYTYVPLNRKKNVGVIFLLRKED